MDTIEKETNNRKCVSVSLRGYIVSGHIAVPVGYHILVAVLKGGQLTLFDPASKQALAQGKADLTTVLSQNAQLNPERKTIHLEVLSPK